MATNTRPTKVPMDRNRKIALAAGALYIATFVTSIPAVGLYHTALHDPAFLTGTGSTGSVALGAWLEVLCAVTGIGTAVALYPIVKRASSCRAVGFVASRTLEAAMIFVGILSVLSIVTLRSDVAAGTDPATLTGSWHSLVAVHDWTFLMGPGFMPALNAMFLATVLYRTRLVPRIIPTVGLIGAPLLFLSSTVTLFGGWEQLSRPAALLAFPIAAWEFSVGMWMLVKGFNSSPVLESSDEVPTVYVTAAAA
ncbi:MAG TPA: DUF4386 domain-containing protein [Acidimicrobiales bacterium]|nr:DUF4386 domain-containing protein [Acidimicrobiales bacterium]